MQGTAVKIFSVSLVFQTTFRHAADELEASNTPAVNLQVLR